MIRRENGQRMEVFGKQCVSLSLVQDSGCAGQCFPLKLRILSSRKQLKTLSYIQIWATFKNLWNILRKVQFAWNILWDGNKIDFPFLTRNELCALLQGSGGVSFAQIWTKLKSLKLCPFESNDLTAGHLSCRAFYTTAAVPTRAQHSASAPSIYESAIRCAERTTIFWQTLLITYLQ